MRVLSGLESVLGDSCSRGAGRRTALLCHPPSVDRTLRSAPRLLQEKGHQLISLFGPEHGIEGEAQDMIAVDGGTHPSLGVPVYSLYGAKIEQLSPRPEQLQGVERVLIDLQDVGSRYYTYIWTMLLMMEACAREGIAVAVLDRPNPLGGLQCEGPALAADCFSFVGLHDIPVRHGLTAGELALLFVAERKLDLELTVVPMLGWTRGTFFDETGLPWVMPSPNMPTVDSALVYPGGCLLEGTNLSEGRGTTRPFEVFGAPWIDGSTLAEALYAADLPGVRFRPLQFMPTFHKHGSQICGGVQLHVVDRTAFRPLRTGVAILAAVASRYPEHFAWRKEVYEFESDKPAIDLLSGGAWLREGIAAGQNAHELAASWTENERRFAERRAPFLLY